MNYTRHYVNSKKIKVFPSAYRGYYSSTESGESGILSFDPEARLNTEYHWVRTSNNITRSNYSSYLVWFDGVDNISFVICGYYFELQGVSQLKQSGKPLYAACRIAHRSWTEEDRYVDTCLKPYDESLNAENLDVKVGDNYEFRGLCLSYEKIEEDPTTGITAIQLLNEFGDTEDAWYFNNGSRNIQDEFGEDANKSIAEHLTSKEIAIKGGKFVKSNEFGETIFWMDERGRTINAQLNAQPSPSLPVGISQDAVISWNKAIGRWYAEFTDQTLGYKAFAISKDDTLNFENSNTYLFNHSYIMGIESGMFKDDCVLIRTYIPGNGTLTPKNNTVPVYTIDESGNAIFRIKSRAEFEDFRAGKVTIDELSLDKITCTGTVNSAQFNSTSDKRLKENIKPFEYGESILNLPVYTFDFKEGPKDQIGCLAQDLQKLYPKLVKKDDKGYLTIQENKLIYLLLEEVKQLKERIFKLESKKE